MALVYRAIWREDPGGALERGHSEFAAWLDSKHQFALPAEGSATKPDDPKVDVVVTRAEAEGVSGLRCVLHEDSGDERWTTTFTVLESAAARPAYWVDLEMVANEAFSAPQAQPPRLVLDLLGSARNPRSGAVPVRAAHWTWSEEDAPMVADFVLDPGRGMPVVVVTPGEDGIEAAESRASRTARKLAGVASVGLLAAGTVQAFCDALGQDLEVEAGSVRVYLPGAGADDAPWRHFVIPPGVAARSWGTAGRIIADRLAISIAARRAPAEYESVRRLLAGGVLHRSVEEIEELWDQAVLEAERLRLVAKSAEEEKALTVLELEDAEKEIEHLRRSVAYVLAQRQGVDALDPTRAAALPSSAEDASDAVRLARQHLGALSIPDAATTTVAELDTAMQAQVWGRKTWHALRALHLYAIDHARYAGFWDWCEHSGDPFAWPASQRTLAMADSETAMNEYGRDRDFTIDPRVRGETKQHMDAHIKVAQAGGSLTPRIYFYDDTRGVTGRVHVGFIGPHKYLRNAGSN